MKHPILSSVVGSVALAAVVLSAAQAQPAPSPRKVSRDELRACLDDNDSLTARRKDLDARADQLKAEQDALKTEGEEITAEREHLERSPNQLRGDRLDRRTSAYKRKVEEAQARAAKYTPDAQALNKDATAFNERCGNIAATASDREAVMKERGAPRQ